MGNRFGFKDFVLLAVMAVVVVVVLLNMKQSDRQWQLMQAMQQQGVEQTRLLASIRRALDEGIAVAPGTTAGGATSRPATAAPAGDSFALIKEAQQRPDYARGDWLIDNFSTKLPRVTPLVSTDIYATWVHAKVIEGLAYRHPDTLKWVPQLARSWQVSDDGLTMTFQLRRGVTFSDGQPFTADDVVFSYQWVMNPKVNAPRHRAYYAKFASVEKTNDHEVVVKAKEPYFELFGLAAELLILPKHFYSKYTEEQFNQDPGLLMGTGAYKLPSPNAWRPGQKVELVRNETYWGEPAPFDRIVFLEVEEEAAEEVMFKNGELDVFATPPEQYERLLKDKDLVARTQHFDFESPMLGYFFLAWNQKRAGQPTRFADVRVRRAMTMLTDRERISRDVFLGYAKPASGPFNRSSPQADPSIEPLPYNVDAAKKLLAEAGYEDRNRDGVLEGPDGKPFRFKLTYGSGNATFERVVLFLKDSFAAAGVSLEADPVDWPIQMKKVDERDYDALAMGWGGSIESDLFQMFHSSQIADQGDNFMSYANPEFDKTVEEARHTVSEEKRMPLWHKCHRILHEDQPYTFLLSRRSLRFMDKRIQNVRPSKIGLNVVYVNSQPIPWYVPRTMQKYGR